MTQHQIEIIKASGERVPFEPAKLQKSLERAGAGPDQIERIFDELEPRLHDGISTHKIYRMAFDKLKKISRGLAARYKLKNALLELGPSGYPFEKFVGEILRHQGYEVRTNQFLEGKCIEHEVDILAENETNVHLIECKYHNRQNYKSDVKIPLYIHSRFKDILAHWGQQPEEGKPFQQGWVVTNTRFSEDALNYGNCVGLRMVSWDQPEQGSLKRMIELARLYPITCLNSLSDSHRTSLLKDNIVLCREIYQNPETLQDRAIKRSERKQVMQEVEELCGDESFTADSINRSK